MANGPNWFIVLGAIYAAVAFLLLAFGAGSGTRETLPSWAGRRSAAFVCAAVAGAVGFAMQAAGQFMHLPQGEIGVVLALAVVPVLLAFIIASDRLSSSATTEAQQSPREMNRPVAFPSRKFSEAAE